MRNKDMAKGLAVDLNGKASQEASVSLGRGQLNWAAIFRATDKAGVKFYYVEDESPSASQHVLETKKYLGRLRY